MNRNRMEKKHWKQVKDNVDDPPWDEIAIDDRLVSSIRETYGIADDETECRRADWQARLRQIRRRRPGIVKLMLVDVSIGTRVGLARAKKYPGNP